MKPTNQDRRELIEDIFAPAQISSAVSAEEVLRLVQRARAMRRDLRRFSAVAVVFLAAAVLSVMFLPRQSPDSSQTARIAPTSVPIADEAAGVHSVNPPIVERVDDERMLSLLDETPAALVRWPDGRRSLLLLVANPPPK
jgi:hypothetical protein